jgi:hypothetical protein
MSVANLGTGIDHTNVASIDRDAAEGAVRTPCATAGSRGYRNRLFQRTQAFVKAAAITQAGPLSARLPVASCVRSR